MYQKVDPADKKIETPDKQNAFFIAGETVKMTDEDPDYPAVVMANYMFGGSGLGTRLSRRIRDKEGLSYGVGSQFGAPTKDDGGNFLASPSALRRTLPRWKPASATNSPRRSRKASPPTKSPPPRRPGCRSAA